MPAGVDGISRNPTRVVRSSLIVTVSSIMPFFHGEIMLSENIVTVL